MKFYQCTRCGKVIKHNKDIKLIDDIYANIHCKECGHESFLYLCDDPNDIYMYYDVNKDGRYFTYDNSTKLL